MLHDLSRFGLGKVSMHCQNQAYATRTEIAAAAANTEHCIVIVKPRKTLAA